MEEKEEERSLHIAMFPWLAMGHLRPFLRLSKLLAQKGHKISFISTPRNIERLPKLPSNLSSSITFISFPLPPFPGSSPGSESSMDVPYHKQPSLKSSFDLLEQPLTEFLRESSPDWVIYDYASYWLPPIAKELGISKVFFSIFNAALLCFIGPPSSLMEESRSKPEDFTVVPPWIPFQSNMAFRYHEIVSHAEKTKEDVTTSVSDFVRFGYSIQGCDAAFVHSSPELEPDWLGLLPDLYQKPVFPTGFLPTGIEEEDQADTTWVPIKKWLDKQQVNSVVYVALGTEASIRPDILMELALGMEKANVPFIWVQRTGTQIPDGFEDRVKERGMVLDGWAPQVKILNHDSVGGFLTHCGWNSLVESLGFGRVPILFPLANDQGLNTRLFQGKGLGVEIPRAERDGSCESDSVAKSVRLAMVDDGGEPIRAKAKLMKGLVGKMDENIRYVDQLVDYLTSKPSSNP